MRNFSLRTHVCNSRKLQTAQKRAVNYYEVYRGFRAREMAKWQYLTYTLKHEEDAEPLTFRDAART